MNSEEYEEIIIADDAEHEYIYAEIQYKGNFVISINQENGINNLTVELPNKEDDFNYIAKSIPLSVLLHAIDSAVKRLKNMQKYRE